MAAAPVGTRIVALGGVFVKTAEDGWSLYGETARRVSDGYPYDQGIPAFEALVNGEATELGEIGELISTDAPVPGTVVTDKKGGVWTRGEGTWTLQAPNAPGPFTFRENFVPDSMTGLLYMTAQRALVDVEKVAAGQDVEGWSVKYPESVA